MSRSRGFCGTDVLRHSAALVASGVDHEPPPQTPHVARPASRLSTAPFGGRPDNRPLAKLTARPSVSFRRDSTRRHRSSGTIRRSSRTARIHSDSGRSVGAHLPQELRFRVLFHTTSPRYVSRVSTPRAVDGDQPTTGASPSVRRKCFGDGAPSAVRTLAIRFSP
jgi:hypothetical protein